MPSYQVTTALPVVGNLNLPRLGRIAIISLTEREDGSIAYHIKHIDTLGKTDKELKKEFQEYIYGKMPAISRFSLKFCGYGYAARVMPVRLRQIRDEITWNQKILLEVQPQTSVAEAGLAVSKGRNLRLLIDALVASAALSSEGEMEDTMWNTRLVVFTTKTRWGKICGPQPTLPRIDSVELAEALDSVSIDSGMNAMDAGEEKQVLDKLMIENNV